jgi:hypothetical protein
VVRKPAPEVHLVVDPRDAVAAERIAAAFAALAGRRARLTLRAGRETRQFEGRVPPRARWPAPNDPCLMLRPGTTDGTHVLAEMAIHLRFLDGQVAVARRRHYETEPLDLQRLPAGPVELHLTALPE